MAFNVSSEEDNSNNNSTIISCLDNLKRLGKYEYTKGGVGCNAIRDGMGLCWEAVAANTTLRQSCPRQDGFFDYRKETSRYCNPNGTWVFSRSDFADCLDATNLRYYLIVQNIPHAEQILAVNRVMEMVGIVLSIICISLSLFVFIYHDALRCKRTKIHINFFVAILLHVTIRLVIYVDQLMYEKKSPGESNHASIQFTGLCHTFYILLNYTLTCVFSWMLVEGIYLNILLTYSIFDDNKQKLMILFYFVGWGVPALLTAGWSYAMYAQFGFNQMCWSGYLNMPLYWTMHGPRLVIIVINVLCLLHVIKILRSKLKENKTTEIEQIKKSARAAILLLPLLGLTHVFFFVEAPIINEPIFAAWTFVSSFVTLYQGIYVSVLYCFLNNEVKNVVRRRWLDNVKFGDKFFCLRSSRSQAANRNKRENEANGHDANQKLIGYEMQTSEMTTTRTQVMSMSETEQAV